MKQAVEKNKEYKYIYQNPSIIIALVVFILMIIIAVIYMIILKNPAH